MNPVHLMGLNYDGAVSYWGDIQLQINLLNMTLVILLVLALPMFLIMGNWVKRVVKKSWVFVKGCWGHGIDIHPKAAPEA